MTSQSTPAQETFIGELGKIWTSENVICIFKDNSERGSPESEHIGKSGGVSVDVEVQPAKQPYAALVRTFVALQQRNILKISKPHWMDTNLTNAQLEESDRPEYEESTDEDRLQPSQLAMKSFSGVLAPKDDADSERETRSLLEQAFLGKKNLKAYICISSKGYDDDVVLVLKLLTKQENEQSEVDVLKNTLHRMKKDDAIQFFDGSLEYAYVLTPLKI
tara:strand:- start:226 stop:882 length:657 start_codon:yes stop_codon:yes gene_type:complete